MAAAQAESAARASLAGTSAWLTVQVRAGADAVGQDRRAREAITAGFGPARIEVTTTMISEPVRVGESRLVVWSAEELGPRDVSIVAGNWPRGRGQAALQAEAAQRAGVAVGDVMDLAGRSVTISATWRPADPSAPWWQGDELAIRGGDASVVGPLMADADLVRALPGTPMLRWSLAPHLASIRPSDLPALARGAAGVKESLTTVDDTRRGVKVQGALAESVLSAEVNAAASGVVAVVPLSVVATVALVALLQVGRVVAAARAADTRLLLARGATRGQILAAAMAEAVVVGGSGALVGGAVVLLGLRAVTGRWAEMPAVTAEVSLLGALVPVALLGAAAIITVAGLAPVARVGWTIGAKVSHSLVGWLAAAHLARSRLAVAVQASLIVMAVGWLTLAGLFGGSSRMVEQDLAALERGADVRAQVAVPAAGTGILVGLPGISEVQGVRAASPVWLDDEARLGDTGLHFLSAPLDRLAQVAEMPAEVEIPAAALAPGEENGPISLPVGGRTLTVRLTGEVAVDAWQEAELRQIPELSRRQATGPGVVDPVEAARQLTAEAFEAVREPTLVRGEVALRDADTGIDHTLTIPELAIPGLRIDWNATTDQLDIRGDPPTSTLATVALPSEGRFVVDGVALRIVESAGPTQVMLWVTLQVDDRSVGTGSGWRSDVAVPADLAGPYREELRATPVEVRIAEASTSQLSTFYVHTNRPAVPPVLTSLPDGWLLMGDPSAMAAVRLGPRLPFTGADPAGVVPPASARPLLPVALTTAAAEAAGLSVGDEFEIFAFRRRIPAVLAAVTRVAPGTTAPRAALAEATAVARALAGLGHALPWPTEVWATTEDPASIAGIVAGLPGVESVASAPTGATSAEFTRRTVWTAASGVLALALAGIAATYVAQAEERRSEVDVLCRLGLTGAAHGASRAIEHALVGVVAALAGGAAGVAIGALVVPPLVRTALGADSEWPVALRLDSGPWAWHLAAAVLLTAAMILIVARAVTRQAATVRTARR
ncbi:MAG TPA: FtsX-like permease family protein [Arachnia sp.]|nr:FtsX-like permease family protein [Arachnia sp.]